ncbi:hypothetical protein [Streptomyces sp. TLI_171]|uniref:hypothetical protein n=1 Tax=Streptomyces sp. TLI_171 TaxID=1938859 RepID=UPI000C1A53BE|nr:hypothetical protein [Streptomyces sp. TLI_171]RKE17647.1 hypothetical protein BX266_0909 [Streptomyces sp. TLI_171]
MRSSDPDGPAPGGDDPDWDLTLDEEFVRSATIREDLLHGGPADPAPRAGRRRLVLGVSAAILAAVGGGLLYLPAADQAEPRPSAAPAAPTPPPPPGPVSAAAPAPSPTLPALPDGYTVPLDAFFPATLPAGVGPDFVRVSAADLPSCTDLPGIAARERETVRRAGRCAAAQSAVYTIRDNRFTLIVLTMATDQEAFDLMNALSKPTEPDENGYLAGPAGVSLSWSAGRTVLIDTAARTDPAKAGDFELMGHLVEQLTDGWRARALDARKRLAFPSPTP